MSDIEEPLRRINEVVQQVTLQARGSSLRRRKKRDLSRPSAKWVVPARVGREQGTALAVVLSTIGCAHARSDSGGCTMCSYLLDGVQERPTADQIVAQFQVAISQLLVEPSAHIFVGVGGELLWIDLCEA